MAKLRKSNVRNLRFDDRNINKGSEYGTSLLNRSITETGMGRSLLADKNGNLIAGNKTLEAAVAAGIENVVEIETDGTEIIVVKRTDLDIRTEKGIKAKILDNTVSKHNYVEDAQVAHTLCLEADIANTETYGIRTGDDDDNEGSSISFTPGKRPIISIEFKQKDILQQAKEELTQFLAERFPSSVLDIRIKGKK
jgi:hypothetical protein